MIAVAILVVAVLVTIGMDLTIRKVYGFPKTQHHNAPSAFEIPFEEVCFPTRHGRRLYGWWVPARGQRHESPPTLILVHGWGRNLERTMPYIRTLHPAGYDLLAFDLRGHGSSDAETYPNMLKFSEDICAAVDFLTQEDSRAPRAIGVIGLSVGGSAAIHATAMDRRIESLITVGAFAHPVDVMRFEFEKRHLPYYPMGWLMLKYLQLRMAVSFERIAPEHVVRRSPAPTLLIHGELDAVVPPEHGRRLIASGKRDSTELWIVPGKGHSDCHEHPEFWDRVGDFLGESFSEVPRTAEIPCTAKASKVT